MTLTIGFATPVGFWSSSFEQKHETMRQLEAAGVDQLFMADHVSFRDGSGTDGFVEVAALSQLHPDLRVMISVYLLALRHPLPVARQLATMSTVAPGRLTLGVGVGGEDRHEIEVCGVDPRTRGRRTDEALTLIRALMTGETVSFAGEFFDVSDARVVPAVAPATPIVIGGRSDAAVRRAGRLGDGWIGAWCSPRRFHEALGLVDEAAEAEGRTVVEWHHGYQPWVGVAADRATARSLVAEAMESFYRVPFEAFEKYVPYGTAADVAEVLAPYVAAGCSMMNLKIVSHDGASSIEAVAEIAAMLRA